MQWQAQLACLSIKPAARRGRSARSASDPCVLLDGLELKLAKRHRCAPGTARKATTALQDPWSQRKSLVEHPPCTAQWYVHTRCWSAHLLLLLLTGRWCFHSRCPSLLCVDLCAGHGCASGGRAWELFNTSHRPRGQPLGPGPLPCRLLLCGRRALTLPRRQVRQRHIDDVACV
jgi:hypothetical protein